MVRFFHKQNLEIVLRDKLSWLREQPIDALIGLIVAVSKKWQQKKDFFAQNQEQGLSFLVSWSSPDNLSRIANEGLRGNRHYADAFIPIDDNGIRLLKSTSKGLVCHWLAGNVQVLGMFVLIQSILSI